MIYIVQNLFPILAATLAGLALGAVAYRVRNDTFPVGLAVAAFVAEFWFCAILAGALILAPPKADAWVMALGTAVVIWIGFVVPALVVALRARAVAWSAVARDCGHWLGVMLVQALVLKLIGLVPPTT